MTSWLLMGQLFQGGVVEKRLLLNDGAIVFDSVDDLKKHFLSF